jgi:hypothetical protein
LFTLRCQTKYCTYACLPILSVYELLRYQRKHIIRNNNDYHCGYEQLATATVPQFFKKLKPLLNYCHHSRSLIEKRYGSSSCHTLRSERFVLLVLLLGDSWVLNCEDVYKSILLDHIRYFTISRTKLRKR